MNEPESLPGQTPTPETILRSLFENELSALSGVAERVIGASGLTGGNTRQRRLRAIFEEAARV